MDIFVILFFKGIPKFINTIGTSISKYVLYLFHINVSKYIKNTFQSTNSKSIYTELIILDIFENTFLECNIYFEVC